jgi:muramoyltetrapeptide carboxypeptidase
VNIKAPRLRPEDRIGIIAPAGPITQDQLQPEIDLLKKKGYSITLSPHLYRKKYYLAGDDDFRLQDFHLMFQDKEIKAVLCARGGYGSLRLIDKIDYELIKNNPKIIIGYSYSDITALLLAINKKTGLITFHGPVVREYSVNQGINLNNLFNLVSSSKHFELNLSGGKVIKDGNAKGVLLGGNLSMISHLTGTPFMPSLAGAILFIEEKGEPIYRIDRMLTHIRLSGALDHLAGLIAGQFMDCGDMEDINRLLIDIVPGNNVPVLSGLPIGHGKVNMTLPIGLAAELDTGSMLLSIMDTCVQA